MATVPWSAQEDKQHTRDYFETSYLSQNFADDPIVLCSGIDAQRMHVHYDPFHPSFINPAVRPSNVDSPLETLVTTTAASNTPEAPLANSRVQSVTVLYRPITVRGRSLYVGVSKRPIQFVSRTSGAVGVVIQDVLDRDIKDVLMDSEHLVNFDQRKLTLRLNWKGCDLWSNQFWTRTYGKDPKSITLGKLAHRIAIAVQKFHQSHKTGISDEPHTIYPSAVELHKVILLGFIHVSRGSWQPDLSVLV